MKRPDIEPEFPTTKSIDDCKVCIVAEAPNSEEARRGRLFIGQTGLFLDRIFESVKFKRSDCYITSVFWCKPDNNKIESFFTGIKYAKANNIEYRKDIPPYRSQYIRSEWSFELDRLESEIKILNPNIIITFGATPLWALTSLDAVQKNRGKFIKGSDAYAHYDIMPTYHPAYVMRDVSIMNQMIEDIRLGVQKGL